MNKLTSPRMKAFQWHKAERLSNSQSPSIFYVLCGRRFRYTLYFSRSHSRERAAAELREARRELKAMEASPA